VNSDSMLYESPDLYDTLLPVSASQLNFYMTVARSCDGAVLSLACGTGQLLVPIAASGVTAAGVDISHEMLRVAQERALAAGAPVDLVEADMREFGFARKFSVIFVARNSLLHLREQNDFAAFFSVVRRHLTPKGVLVFDIFNPDVTILSRPAGKRFHVMKVTSPVYGELTVETTNDYDRQSQVNRATWFVSTDAQRDAWSFPLHLRSIFPQELLALLAANGFRLMRRDGDYAGGTFYSASAVQVCQCQVV
jgi:SAM-dependent methyltransferase